MMRLISNQNISWRAWDELRGAMQLGLTCDLLLSKIMSALVRAALHLCS